LAALPQPKYVSQPKCGEHIGKFFGADDGMRHHQSCCCYTYIHTYIHTYTHTCMHACMHTYIHTFMCVCVCVCVIDLLKKQTHNSNDPPVTRRSDRTCALPACRAGTAAAPAGLVDIFIVTGIGPPYPQQHPQGTLSPQGWCLLLQDLRLVDSAGNAHKPEEGRRIVEDMCRRQGTVTVSRQLVRSCSDKQQHHSGSPDLL
jgi:hypothetical protein